MFFHSISSKILDNINFNPLKSDEESIDFISMIES